MDHLNLEPHPMDRVRRQTDVAPNFSTESVQEGQSLLDSLMEQHRKKQQSKKNEDIFDRVKFFKDIKNPKDRKNLKESLIHETFKPGQVLFNYGKW